MSQSSKEGGAVCPVYIADTKESTSATCHGMRTATSLQTYSKKLINLHERVQWSLDRFLICGLAYSTVWHGDSEI